MSKQTKSIKLTKKDIKIIEMSFFATLEHINITSKETNQILKTMQSILTQCNSSDDLDEFERYDKIFNEVIQDYSDLHEIIPNDDKRNDVINQITYSIYNERYN